MNLFVKLLGLIVLLVVVLALLNMSKIKRLMRVNSLFEPTKIVQNFSDMGGAFFEIDLPISGTPHDWPEAPQPLPETISIAGESVNLAEYLKETHLTALVVVKDGQIVSENYYQGTGRDDQRISWSMAKSFLSAIFGVAVENGDIESLDDPVIKYIPALTGTAYETSTVRHVLNMSSGVRFNEDYYDKDSDINKMARVLALGGSMDEFAASLKELEREPGVARQYVSIDTHVAGMVLRSATGQSARDYFIDKLWSKIGPGNDAYYLTDGEEVAFVLGGLNMRTRDYALFGQLMLQGGEWNGEQIIPADWVRESTAVSAEPPLKADGFGYGYQWWIPEGSTGDYMASGIYGQQIFIDPDRNIVIAKNASHIDFNRISPRGKHYKREAVDLLRALAEYYGD